MFKHPRVFAIIQLQQPRVNDSMAGWPSGSYVATAAMQSSFCGESCMYVSVYV